MAKYFSPRVSFQVLLEASILDSDPNDAKRYYKLEAGFGGVEKTCKYSAKDSSGTLKSSAPLLGVTALDTSESITSEQTANLVFNGSAVLAVDLAKRVRPMDRLRVTINRGNGNTLAFDGFISGITTKASSSPEGYSTQFTLSAQGLWKFMLQSWFNWSGAIQPGYDVFQTEAGKSLWKTLSVAKLDAQDIIRAFIETALAMAELKTKEGVIKPGTFFELGTGKEWKSAFGLSYPLPANTLQTMRGPLAQIIQTMTQPDIHECFCTYRLKDGVGKPTIIFRERPFPGKENDDTNWLALAVHRLKSEPAAKTISASRNDSQHPNAFHWAQGSTTTTGLSQLETKILYGCWVDDLSLKRYGYAARPVAPSLTPLTAVGKDEQPKFLGYVQDIVQRLAYQDAPLPETWNRTIQVPLRPGIRPGDALEEYSTGRAWTGYVVGVQHRLSADPWQAYTTVTMIRCLPCAFEEYPAKVRSLVKIVYRPYYTPNVSGAADPKTVLAARKLPFDPTIPAAAPVAGINYGAGIITAAKARGVPSWVVAQTLKSESGFGVMAAEGAAGIMQFRKTTANDLNSQGYDKPFSYEIAEKDPAASLDAGAWYLAKMKRELDKAMPSIYDDNYKWSWAMRAYNKGLTNTLNTGRDNNWAFPDSDKATNEYKNYWGPDAAQRGQAQFGVLQ